jgi:2-C-methyl-D-erythritol 4-phosphate cytidylyltransferase
MGRPGGKQLMPLAGKPVLAHTLRAFQDSASVNAIILVIAEENIDPCRALIAEFEISKAISVVASGAERQDSVYNGLKAAGKVGDVRVVTVHDGARPLVTVDMIDRTVAEVVTGGGRGIDGVVVGIPAKDTIKLVREGVVVDTVDRSQAWQVQTPQAFVFNTLIKAHEFARADGFYGTDDAVLIERMGGTVTVIAGADENIKITTPTDIVIAEVFLAKRDGIKSGDEIQEEMGE